MFWQFMLDNKKKRLYNKQRWKLISTYVTYQYSTETSTFDAIEKRAESFDFLSVNEKGNEMINSHN